MTKEDIEYVKECIQDDKSGIHRFYVWSKWENKRKEVLKMDHYECQDCKAEGRYKKATTVHHNQYVKRHPELALEIWYMFRGKKRRNLISLCHECHEKRHGYRKAEGKTFLTEERWD